VVCTTLRLQGYEVLQAGNGHQGRHLAAIYPHRIDLVLTDVVMPGLDGPALVAQLRLTRRALKALFISGYTERAFVQKGVVQAGAPFLEKPFTPAELLAKIRTVLDEPTPEAAIANS
jgi:DNA-binding response OmpR family regulator